MEANNFLPANNNMQRQGTGQNLAQVATASRARRKKFSPNVCLNAVLSRGPIYESR